tara:strand:+ start:588 stop:893 length:306 start_codon:yes stop_codon:yes gene_type:complete
MGMDPKNYGVMDPHGAGSGLGFQIGLMQNPNVPRLVNGVPVRPSDKINAERRQREKEARDRRRRLEEMYAQQLLSNAFKTPAGGGPVQPQTLQQILQGGIP